MQKSQNCVVADCPNHAHAKGYCRRHYGQMWRRGMIYEPGTRRAESEGQGDGADELGRAEHELEKAKAMYDAVVGFEGRMKWRKKIAEAQEAIRLLQETASGVAVRG
jgi:hypothetical protein